MTAAQQKTFTSFQNQHRQGPAFRLCRRLAFNLLRRNCRKYSGIVIALFLGHWRVERWRLRLIRVSYLYFRYLDDIVDGDLVGSIAPRTLLDEQMSRWRFGMPRYPTECEANILFCYLWNEFEQRALPLSCLRFLAESVINGIELDLERRVNRRVLSRAELDVYYEKVILAPAQLAHTILDAGVTMLALQEISMIIGRLQSARDLHSDWGQGLINIPLEDLGDANVAAQVTLPRRFESWQAQEIDQCTSRLRAIWRKWSLLASEHSRLVMRPPVETLLHWALKHASSRRTCS